MFRQVGDMTISKYLKQLDEMRLAHHIKLVKACIQAIITNGGNFSAKIAWDQIEDSKLLCENLIMMHYDFDWFACPTQNSLHWAHKPNKAIIVHHN